MDSRLTADVRLFRAHEGLIQIGGVIKPTEDMYPDRALHPKFAWLAKDGSWRTRYNGGEGRLPQPIIAVFGGIPPKSWELRWSWPFLLTNFALFAMVTLEDATTWLTMEHPHSNLELDGTMDLVGAFEAAWGNRSHMNPNTGCVIEWREIITAHVPEVAASNLSYVTGLVEADLARNFGQGPKTFIFPRKPEAWK